MSLFTKNNKKIHFIHIPKTMGSSIITAFKENGWKYESPPGNLWQTNKMEGHPQKNIWEKWEKVKNVDFRFSIVRNPYNRMMSLIRMWIQFKYFDELAASAEKARISNNEKRLIFLNNMIINFSKVYFDENRKKIVKKNKYSNSSDDVINIMFNHIENYFQYKHNVNVFSLSNEDLISFYFKYNLKNAYDVGLNCTPMTEFISEDTKIYKMESDIDMLLVDLKNLKFIDKDYYFKKENVSKIKIGKKEESWSTNSFVKMQFYQLYEEDFKKFEY